MTQDLHRSVVKLFTVIQEPNHYHPWEAGYSNTSGGSACVIEGHRILTNAHVVAHARYVQVLRPGDSQKYTARVLHVDHDTETALLTVDEPGFFDDTEPVRFGALPSQGARVTVYGFPRGGNELCTTVGVVSRIEVRTYTHSQRTLLAIQTDAAINPGNSGGPVFMDGELVGIAFQFHESKDLARTGYIVPISMIEHFLADLADGAITGVPDLGVFWQKLENRALRAYVELPAGESGILVSSVVHGSSAHGLLEEGDVITAIDGVTIANDGSIALRDHHRVHFTDLVSRHQVGERVAVRVSRRGQPLALDVLLRPYATLVPLPQPAREPRYLIFAGIVFVPLTYEYLDTWGWEKAHYRFKHYYYDELPSERRSELVIVGKVLAHDINVGYHQMHGVAVDRINGVEIRTMHDVARAILAPVGGFHVIEIQNRGLRSESMDYHTAYGTKIVLDAALAARATEEILASYRIRADRSADLG